MNRKTDWKAIHPLSANDFRLLQFPAAQQGKSASGNRYIKLRGIAITVCSALNAGEQTRLMDGCLTENRSGAKHG